MEKQPLTKISEMVVSQSKEQQAQANAHLPQQQGLPQQPEPQGLPLAELLQQPAAQVAPLEAHAPQVQVVEAHAPSQSAGPQMHQQHLCAWQGPPMMHTIQSHWPAQTKRNQ